MEQLMSYALDELTKGHSGIIIRTQEGTEVMIRIVDGKTLVTFPFGNRLESPQLIGILSRGVLATEVPNPSTLYAKRPTTP